MLDYTTPGVYIEEQFHFPPAVESVETAVPAFIGHTCQAQRDQPGDLLNVPLLIRSLRDYEHYFGGADSTDDIEIAITDHDNGTLNATITKTPCFLLYYSLRLFFANGGRSCYIISVADYSSNLVNTVALETGLDVAGTTPGITLIVFPDALTLPGAADYYALQNKALQQCAASKFRMVIMDVFRTGTNWQQDVSLLRSSLTNDPGLLKYGAAYFPRLFAPVDLAYTEDNVTLQLPGNTITTLSALKATGNSSYYKILIAIGKAPLLVCAAPAIAGIYTKTDHNRGVWKAPANVNIEGVTGIEVNTDTHEQEELNVDQDGGKSINVIRALPGKGNAIVWGARTLAGNDNEWRYISTRRFFNMVEESIQRSTEWVVFESNTSGVWTRVKAQIENYFYELWRSGALMGSKPEQAFYVNVGLNITMTESDISQGHLIIETGLAVIRPAEFIILRISHNMQA